MDQPGARPGIGQFVNSDLRVLVNRAEALDLQLRLGRERDDVAQVEHQQRRLRIVNEIRGELLVHGQPVDRLALQRPEHVAEPRRDIRLDALDAGEAMRHALARREIAAAAAPEAERLRTFREEFHGARREAVLPRVEGRQIPLSEGPGVNRHQQQERRGDPARFDPWPTARARAGPPARRGRVPRARCSGRRRASPPA